VQEIDLEKAPTGVAYAAWEVTVWIRDVPREEWH
jgi:hypothetical protein